MFTPRKSIAQIFAQKNDKDEEIFHSSAYARAQSGAKMAVGSAQSYADRKKIEEQRKHIKGYNNARIFSSASPTGMAKTYTPKS